jgi:crotonobetainyl-CoA:carnitine CoA-transferase CaiB-like acyl-CoA transferase
VLRDADGSMKSSFVSNFRPFRFRDGWGITTPTSDADFSGMCKAFGVDGYDDPRVAKIANRAQHPELTREIMARCYSAAEQLTTAEAMERMEAQRVPCGVVLSPAELVEDPHARAIGLFEDSDDPVVGRVRRPRHPARFGTTGATLGGPAPALGQHTDDVLRELGMGERIDGLRADGIVG